MECLCSPSSRGRALGQGAGTALWAKAVQPDTRFQPLLSLRLKNVGLRSHGAGEGRPHAGEGHGTLDRGPQRGQGVLAIRAGLRPALPEGTSPPSFSPSAEELPCVSHKPQVLR